LELVAAPFAQPGDPLLGLDVVIEGRADENADIEIGAFGQPPIVEAMNELLEARKGQRAALPRFRDQAIAADMGAGRVPQRKSQPISDDLSGQDSLRENGSSFMTVGVMDEPTKIIAVVRGAANAEIQEIFRELADQWRPDVQLAGLVAESHGLPDRHCQAGYLRNLATGARYSIFHDLGPGVTDCHLDGIGAVAAAATVQRDIAESCDLVLLNKFGKLEAAGGGIAGAFRAALAAGFPLLTSVSPAHDEAWRQFTKREFAVLPADPAAIDLWRRAAQTVAQANRCEERRAP
jgi:hypothetical protein